MRKPCHMEFKTGKIMLHIFPSKNIYIEDLMGQEPSITL